MDPRFDDLEPLWMVAADRLASTPLETGHVYRSNPSTETSIVQLRNHRREEQRAGHRGHGGGIAPDQDPSSLEVQGQNANQ